MLSWATYECWNPTTLISSIKKCSLNNLPNTTTPQIKIKIKIKWVHCYY